ncbi:lycopene cyclase domain-containing protein [Microbacterium sp. CIAB417]|uniref:lycopene cyclase domain-containing protein n=1 Tax=Microbacterium sp. CIAB417 TaxID=2860287 RepID=UPI001FAC9656|nr:lycopene cyclase domain-containing protein [Microbacterium sp. CIAB417]
MTYALLSLVFLGLAVALAGLAALRARRLPRAGAIGLALGALLVLTAVFDSIMIGAGFFTYADPHLSGLRIGLAPIEDFAYPIAAAILLPSVWVLLRTRRASEADGIGTDAGLG